MTDKQDFLNQTAQALIGAAKAGALGRPVQIFKAETIAGPRAGALRLFAGLATGYLYRVLSADDAALARQFIAWPFPGAPQVYLDGRAVRVEAPWPPELATAAIRLREISPHPRLGGRWVIGVDEVGRTVIGGLTDSTPHWLVAGTTGSGKTTALIGAAYQLAQDPALRLVLVDGKEGAGLAPLQSLPGVVGPLAGDLHQARRALAWVHNQIKERYTSLADRVESGWTRVVVIFDEFQEFTDDPLVAELLRRVVLKGRAAGVHCLLATQHPTVGMFGKDDGGAVKRNLPGRLALRVLDAESSRVAVGAPVPRADRLTGAGDGYTITASVHRVQVALVEQRDLDRLPRAASLLEEYPDVEAEDLGQEVDTPRWAYTGAELACGLAAAARGWGRPRLSELLASRGLGRPGAERAIRLLQLGREALGALDALGLDVVERPVWRALDAPEAGAIVDPALD